MSLTVAIIAFTDINPFLLAMPWTVFRDAAQSGTPRLNLMVCSAEGVRLDGNAGFGIVTRHTLVDAEGADLVIVPTWRDPAEQPPEQMLDFLRRAHRKGATIVGLCHGTFVLAAAGLLEGRPATTHWMSAMELKERYPQTDVRPDVLYVDDGDIITSAGVAAGIDCCLHILRTLQGAEAAARAARRLVVPPHRQGGQAQYIDVPVTIHSGEDRFRSNLEWLQQHLEMSHNLDSLAKRFMMSRRTFTRRFRQVTGSTVGEWLLNQRLALAQRLLETTSASIGAIAGQSGFGSEMSLRHHFNKQLKTSPARYRREFRGRG